MAQAPTEVDEQFLDPRFGATILDRLPITLLEQALNRLIYDTNITAAQWFMQALVKPSETRISA